MLGRSGRCTFDRRRLRTTMTHSRALAHAVLLTVRRCIRAGVFEPLFLIGDRRLCLATTDRDIDETLEAASLALSGAGTGESTS